MSDAVPSPAPPYVREMRPDEQHAVALLCTRAFATNRFQVFLGSLKRGGPGVPLPPAATASPKELPRAARLLYYFQDGLVRTMLLTGGRVMVVAQPLAGGTEKIVAAALWNRPGADIAGPVVILRAKQHRAILGDGWHPFGGWSFTGLRRALRAQALYVKYHANAAKAHGYTLKQCWALETLGTDPDEEGKGHASRLLREGFAFIGTLPCVLEVPSTRIKQIYEHFGFQETGVLDFGVGQVDDAGMICAKSDADKATGIQVWTMIRIPKA